MCPDRQLLSVYFDGELPSPWKEKLETHLEACAACSARLRAYRGGSSTLRAGAPSPEAVEAARGRAWRSVAAVDRLPRSVRGPVLRPLAVPVPAAAAALLAVAVGSALVGGPVVAALGGNGGKAVARIDTEMTEALPVADMGGVMRYLESQESPADIVIIRLPEAKSFSSFGEPTLVRAADYHRSSPSAARELPDR